MGIVQVTLSMSLDGYVTGPATIHVQFRILR